jgi:threonyl-tRNA synthetase
MKITLKDGSVKEYAKPMSVYDIAKDISEGLARNAYAGKVDGEPVDLRTVVDHDAEVEIVSFDDPEGRHAFWHTSSHILAQAVLRLYPDAKLAIGPAIKDGFYYDIEFAEPLLEENLDQIEKEMKKIVKEKLEISRFEKPREEAIEYFKEKNQPYKVELIEDLPEGEPISFYQQGEFIDLCAGPHLMNVKPVKALKLTSIAGAYWRGDEHRQMLTRIYGTSYPKKAELDAHLARIEEAKKRDHRRLGKEMRLFTLMDEGPGFPFFLPNGMIIKNSLMQYWQELHDREGYQMIETPIMLNRSLWEKSGHWDHYKDNMYTTKIDDEDFAIKPMNCPGSLLVYNSEPHSYRDLPLRLAEVGLVHRHEKSGQMHGLTRVRAFHQDDAHIFMTPDQVKDEIEGVIRLIDEVYKNFGFVYHVELSTRPEDSMGTDEEWNMAIEALEDAMKEIDMPYVVNEGDGAFYGPKLDFHLEDSLGRTWQCATIQLDFQLPQRFEAEYVGQDGEKHRPIMIHRVVYGSIERFMAILIEHFGGKFPAWLAPEQVRILPITDRHLAYAQEIEKVLKEHGIRVHIDDRNEKTGWKVRQAQVERIPYMLVIGDREMEDKTVALRLRDKEKTKVLDLAEFADKLGEEIHSRQMSSAFLDLFE